MTVLWFSHLVKKLSLAWLHENLHEVLAHENRTRSSKNWACLAELTCGKWKLYWFFCLHSQHKQLAHACMCWSKHKYANRHGPDIFLLSSIWRVPASILLASQFLNLHFRIQTGNCAIAYCIFCLWDPWLIMLETYRVVILSYTLELLPQIICFKIHACRSYLLNEIYYFHC